MPRLPSHGSKNRPRGNPEAINEFPARTNLFDLDHPSRCIYFLRAGRVRLSHGRETVLAHLTPGNFFGEECLLKPNQRFQVARSLSPVAVFSFRPSELLDRVQQDRRFALRLLNNLTLRLNRYEQIIRDFVTEPAERRVALLLFRLAPARPSSGWAPLRFSPSNAELARTIGTTRARISHFLKHFRQMGWLERRPELWIRREGLQQFLGENGEQAKPRR
jgi:CRP/FNR family cyclic AMP-dependent transcriptional regulator